MSDLAALLDDFDPKDHSETQLREIERLSLVVGGFNLTERGRFGEFSRKAWHVLEPQTVLKWNWHLSAMATLTQVYTVNPELCSQSSQCSRGMQ